TERRARRGAALPALFVRARRGDTADRGGIGLHQPSLRANGSRECAPDDSLREAIHCGNETSVDCFVAEPVIGLAEGETRWLLAMTEGAAMTLTPSLRLRRRRLQRRRFRDPRGVGHAG